MDWSATIEAVGSGEYDVDWASELIETLEGRGPAVSVGKQSVGVTFDISAETAELAIQESLRVFHATLPDLTPIDVRVQTVDEQERELAKSNVPELMGVSEIAVALGISKQRVSELTEAADFPAPITRLKAGPIWQRSALARFMNSWNRSPGRRRTTV